MPKKFNIDVKVNNKIYLKKIQKNGDRRVFKFQGMQSTVFLKTTYNLCKFFCYRNFKKIFLQILFLLMQLTTSRIHRQSTISI